MKKAKPKFSRCVFEVSYFDPKRHNGTGATVAFIGLDSRAEVDARILVLKAQGAKSIEVATYRLWRRWKP